MRQASINRDTTETQINLSINLDGNGTSHFDTGLPFFDHMLTQIARYGMIDIHVEATGDLEVDAHHMVEDVGIVLGQALNKAIGDKSGLTRYGHAYVPLDEACPGQWSICLGVRVCTIAWITPEPGWVILMSICCGNFFRDW